MRMPPKGQESAMRSFPGRFAVVAVLGAVVLSFNFGSRLLLTNDDTRFPILARDALVNGHWLIPVMPDGTPHIVKPPLAAWLIALASWPAGSVSVRTAVLPSLLAAIGIVLLTYWLGRRLFNPDAGVVAGLTVATTVGMYTMAHSSMPDMVQLVAGTGAIAVYVASGFGATRAWLVPFYAVLGLGTLAKGVPGLIPLAIVLVDTIASYGLAGPKRLVSLPGWIVLAALALPWWIVAAAAGGPGQFVYEFVTHDQLIEFFWHGGRGWQVLAGPVIAAVPVLLPWGLLLPFAVRRGFRESDPDTRRRVRLLLVWLATVFALIAISAQQRERYYLPLCPAAALLIGWWYSMLAWRWRARAFAGAWLAVVVVGAVAVTLDTPRYNATTDLRGVRAVLAQAPAPVFALDLHDVALSFNLDRPVVNTSYRDFEDRGRHGRDGYLLISDRAFGEQPIDPCMLSIARGLVTRRPFSVLDPTGCGPGAPAAEARRSG
jgi:4-amino-4-deoxy-L-arabinose transferase-like glycosyltransferase